MKRTALRLLALLLTAALLLPTCLAAALGGILREEGMTIYPGMTYHETTYWSTAANGRQTEHYYTYTPDGAVTPSVYFGTTLYGRSTLDEVTEMAAASGQTIVAAVNGSFFQMSNGIPYGLVVTDGILRSSGDINSVGFYADGTAVIGTPGLKVRITLGTSATAAHYNKAMTVSNGLIIYSRDYDTYTKNTIRSYNVVVRPERAELTMSGSVRAEVLYAGEAYSAEIPEGCFTISMAVDTPYTTTLAELQSLEAGDVITIETACDAAWEQVVYACGGDDLLVENGTARTAFTLDSADNRTSRTAIGLRADGTLVVYTVDGLQTGYSLGVTLSELAARMVELGCVIALNLDGGGSTTAGLRYPGYDALETVNSPSGGVQRACANFILFTMPTQTAGQAEQLFLYPQQAIALPGAEISYEVRATDAAYYTADVPDGLIFSASAGTVSDDGVFTAGDAAGTVTVQAIGGLASGSATVTVIDEPTSLQIRNGQTTVSGSSVSVAYGGSVDLTAAAVYSGFEIYCSDRSVTWSVTDGLGTIDEDGVFTANGTGVTSGTITATCGSISASVTVQITDLDETPPIVSVRLDGGTLTAQITDDLSGVDELVLTYDDEPVEYTWDGQTLYAQVPDGVTIIKLTASDRVGNRAGAYVETGYEAENVFADMEGNWASKYVNYLYGRGVLQGRSDAAGNLIYAPSSAMTRQAFITSLIRWLGVDTSQYDSVELPFADADQISDYALPSIRAAYALGYLNGRTIDGELCADPGATITRQEAMAILGRSQPTGYAEDDLTSFSDADQVSSYARSYIAQMVSRGIISGSNGLLNPRGAVTRAQVAKMLYYLT